MDHTHLDPTRGALPRAPQAPPPGPSAPGADGEARNDPLHDVKTFGGYRILRRLGGGGMGAVYLGYRNQDQRQVAIKVLNDRLAGNQGYIDRFYREARSGALLHHPNIVRTLAYGQERATGKHYLVLELVDGPSAGALLQQRGRLPVGDSVHLALDVARALEHAHSRNFIHRDIKPDNILITRSGVAKLVDLGLAKRTDEASHLTVTRQGFGTTPYMPFEQAVDAKTADHRSDVYALGATLYHLVTGQVPFPGESHLEVIDKKNVGRFAPASTVNPEVPPALDEILGRMLAREPRDRYQTASELIIDLERSHLAAPMPSYADPDQARQDPWAQACMAPSEPTRLDPAAPPRPAPTGNGPPAPAERKNEAPAVPGPAKDVWLLRYRNGAGRPVTVMTTTEQIRKRREAGTLGRGAEARRPHEEDFEPIDAHPELRGEEEEEEEQEEQGPPPARRTALLLGVGVALVAVVLLGALLRWLLH